MKHVILLITAICFVSLSYGQSVFGGESASLNLVANTGTAQGTWEEVSHNFGEIVQDQAATFIFVVKNTGETPLTITRVKPSCSCSVAEYTEEPIAPGKTGFVKATYDAHSVGVFSKTIMVTTNEESPNTVLRMRGEVLPKPGR